MPSFMKMTVQKQFLVARRVFHEAVVAMAVHYRREERSGGYRPKFPGYHVLTIAYACLTRFNLKLILTMHDSCAREEYLQSNFISGIPPALLQNPGMY